MNKKWIIILGLFLFITVGIFSYSSIRVTTKKQKNRIRDQIEETYHVKIIEEKNCTKEQELYYRGKNQNIYTYCIDSIKIENKGTYIELKSLEERDNTLYHLLKSLKKIEVYKDGGSTLYEDTKESKQSASSFRILQCRKISNTGNGKNQDIYIGIKEMGYEKGFCED